MGVETENNEIAAKGFENTDFVDCISVVRVSREILPVGYLKGRYKSESSLMTCVAELHGSVIRMPSSILSHIGSHHHTHTGQSLFPSHYPQTPRSESSPNIPPLPLSVGNMQSTTTRSLCPLLLPLSFPPRFLRTDPDPFLSFSPFPQRLCSRRVHTGGPQGQVAQSGPRRRQRRDGGRGRAGGEGEDWSAQCRAGRLQVADRGPAALRAERATAARARAGESAAAHARTAARCLGMSPPCCSSVPAPVLAPLSVSAPVLRITCNDVRLLHSVLGGHSGVFAMFHVNVMKQSSRIFI